jgi:hypothetical protein
MNALIPKRHIVVVLGMHRSGTSAVARALKVLGIELGDRLLPAQGDNPSGFWEDGDIVSTNDQLLALVDERWDTLEPAIVSRVFAAVTPEGRRRARDLLSEKISAEAWLGLKDPRMSRLLPFWQEIFDGLQLDTSYVVVVRHPLSVANSLASRHGMPVAQSLLLWLLHTLEALLATSGQVRLVVDFDRLMERPQEQVMRIAAGLNLGHQLNVDALESYRHDFLSEELRHTRFELADLVADDSVLPSIVKLYSLLQRVAADEASLNQDASLRVLADAQREMQIVSPVLQLAAGLARQARELDRGLLEQIHAVCAERDAAMAERDAAMAERDAAIVDRDAILRSTSWSLTAPLRKVADALMSAGKRLRLFASGYRR